MSENKEFQSVLSKHEYTDKPNKPSAVKGLIIKILAAVLVLALLVGGIVLVGKNLPSNEEETLGVDTSATVVNYNSSEIESVTVKSVNEKIKFLSGKDATGWYIDGISARLINSSTIAEIISDVSFLSATESFEKKSGIDYGFNSPFAEIYVKLKKEAVKDEKDYTLKIGNLTANEESRYLEKSGDDTVFLIPADTADSFLIDPLNFASTDVVDSAELTEKDSEKTAKYFNSGLLAFFDKCTVSGKRLENEIEITHIENEIYNMEKPKKGKVMPESVTNFLGILKYGLQADGIYAYDQTDAEKYGLNNPIKITVIADKFSAKVNIGKLADGFYAVTSSKKSPIFKVAEADFEFLFNDVDSYFSKNVFSENVDSFKSVTVKTEDLKTDLTFIKADSEKENPRVFNQDTELEFEQFRRFYKRFLNLKKDVDTKGKTASKLVLAIKFEFFDSSRAGRKIEFKQYTARKFIVFVDNEPQTIIDKTTLNDILNSYENLKDGLIVNDIDLT